MFKPIHLIFNHTRNKKVKVLTFIIFLLNSFSKSQNNDVPQSTQLSLIQEFELVEVNILTFFAFLFFPQKPNKELVKFI